MLGEVFRITQLSIAFRSTPERNRTIVAGANRAVLTETIVPSGAVDQFPDVVFPTVERIYQSPVFRVAMAGGGAPGDENWWKSVPERECLDLFFAAFLPQFMSGNAVPVVQGVALGALFVFIAAATDTVYALAAGAVGPALSRASGVRALGRRLSGLAFIGLGLYTAVSGSRSPMASR